MAISISLYISVIFGCFACEIVTKKKSHIILPIILLSFLIILMGGNTDNVDYTIYKNIYESTFFTKDIGFGILINIAKNIGLNISQFRLAIAIMGLGLIHASLMKLSSNPAFFYILYFIYPFFYDVVQVRNFLAMSVFIFAITFLIENKPTNKIIYIILILVAASIQKVSLIYVPIIFIKNFQGNKKMIKLGLFIVVCISVIFSLNKPMIARIITNIAFNYSSELVGINNYLKINTNLGWLISWAQQFTNFLLVANIRKYVKSNKNSREIQTRYVDVIYNVNLYMFIFLPLYLIDENYTRIFRNIMPLNSIALSMVSGLNSNKWIMTGKINKGNLLIGIGISYNILLFMLLSKDYWESIVVKIFTMNWMW